MNHTEPEQYNDCPFLIQTSPCQTHPTAFQALAKVYSPSSILHHSHKKKDLGPPGLSLTALPLATLSDQAGQGNNKSPLFGSESTYHRCRRDPA